MRISEEEYHNYEENSQGYCTDCDDFTRDCTEPDAEEYDCPCCEQNTVMGTMNALIMGLIEIEE